MNKKKILITGASRGIGLAIAKQLCSDYDLILHASSESSFAEKIDNSEILIADLSNTEAVQQFCKTIKTQYSQDLYAVINNAGITLDKSIVFQPERDIDKMINVNLKAPILISKAAFKIFCNTKSGVIINLSSCVAISGNAFQSVYAATKAGIIAFSSSLAKEAAALNDEHQIRVLCVSPGFIETDMTDNLPAEIRSEYLKNIPAKRFGMADDIANTISFLLSEKASYINGTNIHVNGGLI